MRAQCTYVSKAGLQCEDAAWGHGDLCNRHGGNTDTRRRKQLLREAFTEARGAPIDDPDYCMATKEETVAFLEGVLLSVQAMHQLDRDYLQVGQADALRESLYIALMNRMDCRVIPPFSVELHATRNLDGTFAASVSRYTGTLLLVRKRGGEKIPQVTPKPAAKIKMKDILVRGKAPWKF